MKLTFNISSKFPVAPDLAKQVARFCAGMAKDVAKRVNLPIPRNVTIRFVGTNPTHRSGRSQVNNRRKNQWYDPEIYIRFGGGYRGLKMEVYPKFQNMPVCPCDGDVEIFLHLVAHEMGHGICGFEGGRLGERQCDLFAARCVDEWRMATQDPAAMI